VLTGVQVAVERRHNDRKGRRWLELSTRAKEGERGLSREGEWWRVLQVWCSLFIGAYRAPGRWQQAVIAGLMALMPLMAGVVKGGGLRHLGSRLNRIDRILIPLRCTIFSRSPPVKNSRVKRAWLGAILGWVTNREVFPGAHE
jgi:hypothetical protein